MRNEFADEITKLAARDERIVLLSADIGNRLFDKYKAQCPGRFYNTGVAEANTISMAAGMASCGLRPLCYTITPFITARCYEQIRVDICYHEMPVIIVGTGAGLSYAPLGATHHSLEDLTIMRALPGMKVLAPGDANELRACLQAAFADKGPTYIRIGKKGEPILHEQVPTFAFGTWELWKKGSRVALLSTGNMLPEVVAAAELLQKQGVTPAVYNCASVKPLDEATLTDLFRDYAVVATIEEHGRVGGFGAAVAEWVVDQPKPVKARLLRFGTDDHFLHDCFEQEEAREEFGLDAAHVAQMVSEALA